jgi:hypothetical protein
MVIQLDSLPTRLLNSLRWPTINDPNRAYYGNRGQPAALLSALLKEMFDLFQALICFGHRQKNDCEAIC